MKKFITLSIGLSFAVFTTQAYYHDQKKNVYLTANPYTTNNTDWTKQLRAGELEKQKIRAFELTILNKIDKHIIIGLEKIG